MKGILRRFSPFGNRKKAKVELDPDEIFLDSENLPDFDSYQLQGRLEKPIGKNVISIVASLFFIVASVFGGKAFILQVRDGEAYAERGENNRLRHELVFAERGIMRDRNGELIAWNEPTKETTDFPLRKYSDLSGLGHVLGYVSLPAKDKSGFYYQEKSIGKAGSELLFDSALAGENGIKLIETDAVGNIASQSTLNPPENGSEITLSIDSKLQSKLYEYISDLSHNVGFLGGAGVIMDVRSGEIIALTSFPEYDPNVLTNGASSSTIQSYFNDSRTPFLDRVTSGLYTPGSIVKPFVAIGALEEGIISPQKEILSTGSISIPNPYDPDNPSIFRDWKAHGLVDMRRALAVSSDVYFYEVGGGFEDQRGLGIAQIEKYMRLFGFGAPTGFSLAEEEAGTIPNPAWKEENFDGDPWRLGNTYHTAIGQYGVQVTPLQMVRAIAAVANGGKLITPIIEKKEDGFVQSGTPLNLDPENIQIVKDGMKQAVEYGTAIGLNNMYVDVGAKTGTAELGVSKQYVNSWVVGFFPYDNPRYAFTILMEKGPRANLVGATSVMRRVMDWMSVNAPEYFE